MFRETESLGAETEEGGEKLILLFIPRLVLAPHTQVDRPHTQTYTSLLSSPRPHTPREPHPFSANCTRGLKYVGMFQSIEKGPQVEATLSGGPELLLCQEALCILKNREKRPSGFQNLNHSPPPHSDTVHLAPESTHRHDLLGVHVKK